MSARRASNTRSHCWPNSVPDARLLAGGHSLLPMMKLRLAAPSVRDRHRPAGGGAGLCARAQRRDPDRRDDAPSRSARIPAAREMLAIFTDAERVIADPVVRNRGTIGGALCQADPSEDLSAVCAAVRRAARDPRRARRAGDRHARVPRRPLRDRGRAGRDAGRDPRARAAARRQRLREGRPPGRRLGRGGGRRGDRARRTAERSRGAGSRSPRWAATSCSPVTLAGREPSPETFAAAAARPRRPASPSRTSAARRSTNGTLPASWRSAPSRGLRRGHSK